MVKLDKKISKGDKTAFVSAFLIGLLVHMPAMLMDVPNHDGLASMHFSQNMITSGRWFLAAVCAASSFYTVPWIIGLIALFELGITSVLLRRIFDTESPVTITLISGLLVSFPSLASTFAYVFTLDGYMAGLLLAVLAVYAVKKGHFILGGISLAFSMGVYQAYLPFAMLLCICLVWDMMIRGEKGCIRKCLNCLYMGITGAVLYYVILMILLKIEGRVLDTYQGIDSLGDSGISHRLSAIPSMYADFVKFTFSKGFLAGKACAAAGLVLALVTLFSAAVLICKKKLYRKVWFYWVGLLTVILVPLSANIVLMITPNVNYHLIMRYQWVLFWIVAVVICDRCVINKNGKDTGDDHDVSGDEKVEAVSENAPVSENTPAGGNASVSRKESIISWVCAVSAAVIFISYAVTDNIGYTNLQRKYEKTYAYALRLLDRIEQTDGYYQGVPIAIMGVIGDDEFPPSEITAPVTEEMIGLNGDYLIYTSGNYEAFIKYYMGATLNFVSEEEEARIYYSDEYIEMESFPGDTSVRMIDGVICVKTEDALRD
ncbi:MAG: glucosyltransferase domain-containing protein [Lachnospiraceae bacterium]|nr:glucosyltransferase domain-containing protein [Lachnospiraceae bacterium]